MGPLPEVVMPVLHDLVKDGLVVPSRHRHTDGRATAQ